MADVELLPLPEWTHCNNHLRLKAAGLKSRVAAYARACVEANLASLQAENERLRAEVERLNAELVRLEKIAGYGGLASDAPERMILASEVYDGMQSCDKWCEVRRVIDDGQPMPESATPYVRADRADRLAEALRDAEKSLRTIADRAGGTEYLMTIGDVRGYANSRANEARAALAQENRND